jgi:hypothetical protein
MSDFREIDNSSDKIFESTLLKIKGQLEIKRKDSDVGLKLLRRFDELKKYQSLYVHKVTELKGDSNSFIILLVEKHLTIIETRRSGRRYKEIEEIEPILIFSVPNDIGRVFIKKETIADKVADMFNKIDIDFEEYPRFSKNYLVVGDQPDLVRQHLPKGLIESLDKVEDMTIEINGNWGLLRPEKNLTDNLLLLLISIGYKMTR